MRKTELMVSGEVIHPKTKASIVSHEHTNIEAYLDQQNRTSSVITQSSSMSRVGLGDNEDLSFCVEDGFYENATLYGKTLVNRIQESSSQDIVLPYEFAEGPHVTINDTKESGALGVELKGQTLVNLCKIPSTFVTMSKSSASINLNIVHNLQANKKYAVIGEISEINAPNKGVCSWVTHADGTEAYEMKRATNKGRFFFTYNVTKEIKTFRVYIHGDDRDNGGTISIGNLMLLEYQEGMENWDIPYFEGMASCKMPILSTVGKNFFNINGYSTKNQYASINGNTITVNAPTTFSNTVYTLTGLKEGELYRVSLDKTGAGEFSIRDTNASSLLYVEKEEGHVSRTFTYEKGATIRIGNRQIVNSEVSFANIQIEHGSTETAHESYKSSILSLPEEVVLRGIGDVKDTLNCLTGEYVQKIGEIVLDGSEDEKWTLHQISDYTTHTCFGFSLRNNNKPLGITHTELRCDRFTWINSDIETEHIKIDGGDTRTIFIYIQNSRLASQNIDSLRAWLSQNPTTIQYELETPIITKANLSSTLKSWNTTTHIYSEIPENTLYPILSHSNPTYPVILKPSTKYSIVANSYSNNHANSPIYFDLGGSTASTTVGRRVTTVTTPSTLENKLLTMSGRGNKLSHVMVIEGEVVGDEPYFEGICDVKSPVVKNVGKNLFNTKEFTDDRYIANTGAMLKDNNSVDRNASPYIKVRPKTAYIFSGMTRSGVTNGGRNVYYCEYDSNKNIVGVRNISVANPYILTTTQNTAYIRTTVKDEDLQTCVMEEASTPTAYEPHKSNTFMPIINDADVLTLTQDMFEQGNVAYNNAAMGSSYESMKESSTIRLRLKELIKVNPNSSYRVTVNDGYVVYFRPFDKNKRKLSNVDIDNPIFRDSDYTTDSRTHYISVFVRKVNDVATITLDEFNATGLGGSKEAGKIIVLRSLPNGVCDTFNTRTGEYVRRIGKIVFNGSEDIAWSPSSYSSANHYAFFTRSLSSAKNNISRPHCDKLPSIESLTEAQRDREGCMISSDGRGYGNFWIKLSSTKIENNVLSLKTYLKQNPITIQYELATPIVSIIDAQGLPYAYKDGHVQLSSGYNGQSLTPRLEYAIQTNRAGVIQANQDRLVNHEKRFRALEMMILHQLIQLEYRRAKGVFLSQTRQIFEGGIQMYHTKYDLLSEFIENKLYRSLEEVLEMLDVYFMLGDLTDGEYDVLYEMLMPSPKEIVEDELKFEGELNY